MTGLINEHLFFDEVDIILSHMVERDVECASAVVYSGSHCEG